MTNKPEYRLLDTGLLTAAENMALDEILTSRAGRGVSPPTVRFLRFKPDAALLGYHQKAERELRLDFCKENGIDINRRPTGGGALLFQTSALGWEIIAPQGVSPFDRGFEDSLKKICTSAARAYSKLGVDASFRPRNDIEVEGRKISGTGGFSIDGGMLFQGTVLIENEIEKFLRALRVPVEKLRKKEIDSLMDRMAFVKDLIGDAFDMEKLKQSLAETFSEDLGLALTPSGLTSAEKAELAERLSYFQSDEWVYLKSGDTGKPSWLRQILQTDDGTLIVNLWLDHSGRLVQKALITGDFFSVPQRLIYDLECELMGKKAQPELIRDLVLGFFEKSGGELLGIPPASVALAVESACSRKVLSPRYNEIEAAELFFVNMEPCEMRELKATALLLPYCSKPVDCDYRFVPDCARCGDCQFAPMYDLADETGMEPFSIQSFEHLIEVIKQLAAEGRHFVGSCCEAFYCKHQVEMEETKARGVLICLDSTTCYDLGKGMEAYVGKFEHQTFMTTELIAKVAREMANG